MTTSSTSHTRPATGVPEHSEPFLAVRTPMPTATMAMTVAIAMIVVATSSVIAWDGGVPAWEAAPLRWVVAWPDELEPVLWALQQPGVLLTPVVVGIVVTWSTRRWAHLLAFTLILPLKLGVEKAIVKQLVDRERPFTSVGDDLDVRGPQLEGLSFPSGHVTTAVATAVLLAAFLPPKWRPVPIGWAVVVMIARLYFGQHNLLDVVAGAALGTIFAVVLWWALLGPRDEAAP